MLCSMVRKLLGICYAAFGRADVPQMHLSGIFEILLETEQNSQCATYQLRTEV